ncbi:hypothetical protein COB57_00125 [Candidatus Peregrinibacteria bacterium]|nr:MAG: hypothetical protein COB57_00125 [Candidatus Peregrinibacteria bacterium]
MTTLRKHFENSVRGSVVAAPQLGQEVHQISRDVQEKFYNSDLQYILGENNKLHGDMTVYSKSDIEKLKKTIASIGSASFSF